MDFPTIEPRLEHLTVLTLARAKQQGLRAHPDATLVGIMLATDGSRTAVAFETIVRVQEFISEMTPASVSVEGAPAEDTSLLEFAVLGNSLKLH